MSHPHFHLTMAAAALAGLAMLTLAGLNGWRDWLRLKQEQLRWTNAALPAASPSASASARIEIADLKERIRKLEAIAAGVDL